MAVIIRLRRDGAKNSPYYRIVVADKHSPRDGKFLELIGTYDPKKKGDNSTVKLERADHWIKKGAKLCEGVEDILSEFEYLFPASNRPPAPNETGVLPALDLSENEQKVFGVLDSEELTTDDTRRRAEPNCSVRLLCW